MERARRLGFLGPGAVDRQVRHAHGFTRTLTAAWRASRGTDSHGGDGPGPDVGTAASPPGSRPIRLVDLGAGGGVPGLVVATDLTDVQVVLLEANGRRAAFLGDAVVHCGLEGRAEVLQARAEEVGRDRDRRGRFDAILARSFGPPAVTAECAAPLLRPGGVLVVSEPPDGADERTERLSTARQAGAVPGTDSSIRADRWPHDGLALLGMARGVTVQDEFTYQVVVQRVPCPARYPRRTGVPAKRPLF